MKNLLRRISFVKLSTWTLAAVALGACGSTAPMEGERTGAQESAILGGTSDTSYSGVGLVWGPEQCTGTLIAPAMVLTAAHCVDSVATGLPVAVSPSAVTFYTGPGSGAGEQGYTPTTDPTLTAHAVAQIIPDPGFTLNPQQFGCPNDQDVAILILTTAISGVANYPLAASEPAIGATGTAVGYGDENSGIEGIRDSATSVVSSTTAGKFADALTVTKGSGLATSGDSGGPLFVNGAIAGVDMCHDRSIVPQTTEWYTRIDKVSAWIDGVVSTFHPCSEARIPLTCGSVLGAFGEQVSCGTCASGDVCSFDHCCPVGATWNVEFDACVARCTRKVCPV